MTTTQTSEILVVAFLFAALILYSGALANVIANWAGVN